MSLEHTLAAACTALDTAVGLCPPDCDLRAVLVSILAAHTSIARTQPDSLAPWRLTLKKVTDFATRITTLLQRQSLQQPDMQARIEQLKKEAENLHAECDTRGLYTASVPPLASQRLCDRLCLCLDSVPTEALQEVAVLGPNAENLRVLLRSLSVFYDFIETLLTSEIGMLPFASKLIGFIRDHMQDTSSHPPPISSAPCSRPEATRFVAIRDALNLYIDAANKSAISQEDSGIITTILQLLWPGVGDEPLTTEMEIMSTCVTFDTKSSELNFPTMLGATENSVLFKAMFQIPSDYTQDNRPTWPTAVAVKMFRPSMSTIAREPFFRQEALRVSTFTNPCLLAVHGVHWPREVPVSNNAAFTNDIVVVSELMTDNLRTIRRRAPASTLEAQLRILIDVASALACLHEAGVCHLGLTPENVLLRVDKGVRYGHAKVDVTSLFRYALFPDWLDSIPLRSWMYIAPELHAEGQPRFTSDIWSLGVLACFLMGGASPTHEKNSLKWSSMHSQKDSAWSWASTIRNRRIRNIFRSCLCTNPKDRPTAAFLVEKLQNVLQSVSANGGSGSDVMGNVLTNGNDLGLNDFDIDANRDTKKDAFFEFEDVCRALSDSEPPIRGKNGSDTGLKQNGNDLSIRRRKRRRIAELDPDDLDWAETNAPDKTAVIESTSSSSPSNGPGVERRALPNRRAKEKTGSEPTSAVDQLTPGTEVDLVHSSTAVKHIRTTQEKRNRSDLRNNMRDQSSKGSDHKTEARGLSRISNDTDVIDENHAPPIQGLNHQSSELPYAAVDENKFDDDGAIFIEPSQAQKTGQKLSADRATIPSKSKVEPSKYERMNRKAEVLQESGRPGCIEEAANMFKMAADAGNSNAQVNYGHCLEFGRGVNQDFCEAAMYFQSAANQGNTKGQLRIGLCHEFGRGTKKDFRVAVDWYKRASDQGNTQAQTNLGIAYHQGHGVERNYGMAAELYRRAVKDGHTAAMLNLGVLSEHGLGVPKDTSTAFRLYESAAAGGNERAMLNLALCYERGHGTPRDLRQAALMYVKSAEAGNHQAQFRAGQCFENGEGVPRNYMRAAVYFKKAAESDNLNAMNRLGLLYEDGRGVDHDPVKAFKLFNAASKHGHSPSTFCLARCYEYGVGVKRSLTIAINCLKKACEQKNPKAMVTLGYKYESGVGVKKSTKEAVRLYKASAALGCPEGELALGQCFYFGYGMEKNLSEALRLYEGACKKNDPSACLELAHLYRDGVEVPQDYQKAFGLYRKSAVGRKSLAHVNLGEFYFYGRGVEIDYKKAIQHFRSAAALKDEGAAEAFRWLGDCYSDGSGVEINMKTAVRYFQKGAEAGSAGAQMSLGCCYENGTGVEVNGTKAVNLYRKAEKGGNMTATSNLGILYEKGKFVKQDYQKAFRQYTRAAEHGVIEAMCNLADCYAEGNGTPKNVSRAFELYKEAAGHGHSGAQCELGACYYHGKGVEQDFKKALELFEKARESEPEAVRQLGTAHFDGCGVEQNYVEALRLFHEAAQSGNQDAYLNIGICHEYGHGVAQDFGKAAEFYRHAADGGNLTAMQCLGNLHFSGKGVKKDLEVAVGWYRQGRSLSFDQTLQ